VKASERAESLNIQAQRASTNTIFQCRLQTVCSATISFQLETSTPVPPPTEHKTNLYFNATQVREEMA